MENGPFLVAGSPKQQAPLRLGVQSVTIGRASDCDVVLNDPAVSRHHARVERRGASYFLIDLGSANGVFINAHLIQGEHRLTPGDEIRLGNAHVRFDVGSEPEVTAVLPAFTLSNQAEPPATAGSEVAALAQLPALPTEGESVPALPVETVNDPAGGWRSARPLLRSWAPTLLRLAVGLFFLYEAVAKALQGYLGGGAKLTAFILKLEAQRAPVAGYRDLVSNLVLPHAGAFSTLLSASETIVGLLLILGLLTRLAAIGGIFLNLNYLLTKGGASPAAILDFVFLALELAILILAADQRLSLDSWLQRRGWDRWLPPPLRGAARS